MLANIVALLLHSVTFTAASLELCSVSVLNLIPVGRDDSVDGLKQKRVSKSNQLITEA